ncbi:MAG: flagellar basal body-associated FliL family protein [Pseudomonadota bacterium]
MADAADENVEDEGEPKKKGIVMPLLIGLVLAAGGGAGGFFAASSGLIGGSKEAGAAPKAPLVSGKTSFVAVDPLVISITRGGRISQVQMRLELEVSSDYASDVAALMPRIMDVLNSYLRAIDTDDISEPATLVRIRAQMLRRVQIVTGDGVVNDLLVQEFVVS